MRQQLPAEWAELATAAGVRPSARGISERTGLATTTITRLIAGNQATPETVSAVADVLGVEPTRIYELAGLDAGDLGPWVPPRAANNLMANERQALEQLIRAVTQNRTSERRGDATEKMPGRPASTGQDTGGEVIELSDRTTSVPERRVASRRDVKPEDEGDPETP